MEHIDTKIDNEIEYQTHLFISLLTFNFVSIFQFLEPSKGVKLERDPLTRLRLNSCARCNKTEFCRKIANFTKSYIKHKSS